MNKQIYRIIHVEFLTLKAHIWKSEQSNWRWKIQSPHQLPQFFQYNTFTVCLSTFHRCHRHFASYRSFFFFRRKHIGISFTGHRSIHIIIIIIPTYIFIYWIDVLIAFHLCILYFSAIHIIIHTIILPKTNKNIFESKPKRKTDFSLECYNGDAITVCFFLSPIVFRLLCIHSVWMDQQMLSDILNVFGSLTSRPFNDSVWCNVLRCTTLYSVQMCLAKYSALLFIMRSCSCSMNDNVHVHFIQCSTHVFTHRQRMEFSFFIFFYFLFCRPSDTMMYRCTGSFCYIHFQLTLESWKLSRWSCCCFIISTTERDVRNPLFQSYLENLERQTIDRQSIIRMYYVWHIVGIIKEHTPEHSIQWMKYGG